MQRSGALEIENVQSSARVSPEPLLSTNVLQSFTAAGSDPASSPASVSPLEPLDPEDPLDPLDPLDPDDPPELDPFDVGAGSSLEHPADAARATRIAAGPHKARTAREAGDPASNAANDDAREAWERMQAA